MLGRRLLPAAIGLSALTWLLSATLPAKAAPPTGETHGVNVATIDKSVKPIDGYTADQRFFLAFAQIWRFKSSPEYQRLLANVDSHSPARWRVLGTLVNVPAAAEAFGPGDPASVAQPGSGKVNIW